MKRPKPRPVQSWWINPGLLKELHQRLDASEQSFAEQRFYVPAIHCEVIVRIEQRSEAT